MAPGAAPSRASFELRATTDGLERDVAQAVAIHRQGARDMVQIYDQAGNRIGAPLRSIDGGLKGLARTSRGLAGPLLSELGPAFEGVGGRIAHVLAASAHLATGFTALAIAAAGVAGVVGGALFESWKKNAEEAARFQSALNSMDTGKIQGELDKLMEKLDEAAAKIRFLQGPAGSPANRPTAPLGMTTDFPDITGPLTGGEAARDKALETIRLARQTLKEAQSDEGAASFTAFEKLQGEERVKAFEDALKAEQDLIARGLAAQFKAIDEEQAAKIEEAAVLLRLDEERYAKEQTMLDAGLKSQLAAIDEEQAAKIEEAALELRLDEARFREEQGLIDRGLAAQLRAIDEEQDAEIAAARESMALDEDRFRRLAAESDTIIAGFADVNSSIAAGLDSLVSRTQTVSQAFEQMGRSIASSITQNAIKRGLGLLEEKLLDILQTIAKTGLSAYLGLSSDTTATAGIGYGSAGTALGTGVGAGIGTPYQHGGVATHPQLATIAEAGPEAVVPLSGGRSIPVDLHGAVGGGGNTVEINIYNQVPDTEVTQQRRQGDLGQEIYDIVIRNVKKGLANGELDSPLSASYGLRRQTVGR